MIERMTVRAIIFTDANRRQREISAMTLLSIRQIDGPNGTVSVTPVLSGYWIKCGDGSFFVYPKGNKGIVVEALMPTIKKVLGTDVRVER